MKQNKNIAILLARLDSTRLPRKHFKKIGNDYLIDCCLNQLKKGNGYKIVLATSDRDIDKPLVEWAINRNIDYFSGDAYNIKNRIKGCVEYFNADSFARVNADSPFINAKLIEDAFNFLETNPKVDLYTNLLFRTFPYGYSVEVFNARTFIDTIDQNPELENVTSFFYNNQNSFNIENITNPFGDFSDIRLTVDTFEDLERLEKLFKSDNNLFDMSLEKLINYINQ